MKEWKNEGIEECKKGPALSIYAPKQWRATSLPLESFGEPLPFKRPKPFKKSAVLLAGSTTRQSCEAFCVSVWRI